MFYKVKKVKCLSDYIILVTFEENVTKYYDIKPLFDKWEVFKKIKEENGLFEKAKVDAGGYGISWNDEIDLSCNELWINGKEAKSNV